MQAHTYALTDQAFEEMHTGAVEEEGHEGLVSVGGDAVDALLPVLALGALQAGVLVVLQEAVVLRGAHVRDLHRAPSTSWSLCWGA